MIEDFDLLPLVEPLQEWFQRNARSMPWREDPTPYHVWISEIMLQQTRVEAVRAYYDRFMKALPDVKSLAECPEDTYLKLWEGLGYYSRVRNLHEAALQIQSLHGGIIPSDYVLLTKLKGIGDYTAGAISSLAYGRRVPAVDGNVLRVIARVTADDTDIMKPSFKKEVRDRLLALMESEEGQIRLDPRLFNQGLMELGALVCIPNGAPHCTECPWKDLCLARKQNRQSELPVRSKAKERRILNRTIFVLKDADRVAIRKRPGKGLLAGLYELPGQDRHMTEEEAIQFVKDMGYNPLQIRKLPPAKHVFSHVEWHMIGYMIRLEEDAFSTEEQRKRALQEELIFVNAEEVEERYAIPSAFSAYSEDIRKD